MDSKPIEVLMITAQPENIDRMRHILVTGFIPNWPRFGFNLSVEKTLKNATQKLTQGAFDIVLLDLSLPHSTGLNSFDVIHELAPHVPVVVLTEVDDEQLALDALGRGAQDYLVKGKFDERQIILTIRRAIERSQLLERLEESHRMEINEQKRLDQLKDEFVSTVSHELRTPLAIIKSAIENLRDGVAGVMNDKQSRTVHIAARNLERLTTLINDLLDLSRLESGKTRVNRHRINLLLLAQEVIQGFQLQAKSKNISLSLDFPTPAPEIYADPDMVIQVLNNLINNALRYTVSQVIIHCRFPLKDIEKKTEEEKWKKPEVGMVEISVEDDGVGISPNDMEKLFNKFEQINRPMGGAGYKGTGLGLAICKEIIAQHEGDIWAESLVGHGATFYFTLPQYSPKSDFWTSLTQSLTEAENKKTSLAMIAISFHTLHGFKKSVGDEEFEILFQQIQEKLNADALRKGDRLFHYTFKEFIAILAQTGRAGAISICTRVKKVIMECLTEGGTKDPLMKFNIGIAIYPEDSTTPEDLMSAAMEDARRQHFE